MEKVKYLEELFLDMYYDQVLNCIFLYNSIDVYKIPLENETKVREKEPGYAIEHTTETIDNVTYNTVFLTPTTSATITFDANEGTVSETTRIVTTRRNYWYITSS